MARSKTSNKWLTEHFNDEFVKRSQKEGYRSRAVYKLMEIDDKDRLLKPGMTIVDLGAAPGSWCELVSKRIGGKGKIFALDILPMDALGDVTFIEGDFTEDAVYDALMDELDGQKVDLVISDMAPNISGMKAVDQPKMMYLAELALEFAQSVLKPGGVFLTKVFTGTGIDEYKKELRQHFAKIIVRKPKASRSRSSEIYLLAKQFKKR